MGQTYFACSGMRTLLKPPCLNRLTPEPMAAFQTGACTGRFWPNSGTHRSAYCIMESNTDPLGLKTSDDLFSGLFASRIKEQCPARCATAGDLSPHSRQGRPKGAPLCHMQHPVFVSSGRPRQPASLTTGRVGLPVHLYAHRTAGGGFTDAGSILPLTQGRASAAGAFLPPA